LVIIFDYINKEVCKYFTYLLEILQNKPLSLNIIRDYLVVMVLALHGIAVIMYIYTNCNYHIIMESIIFKVYNEKSYNHESLITLNCNKYYISSFSNRRPFNKGVKCNIVGYTTYFCEDLEFNLKNLAKYFFILKVDKLLIVIVSLDHTCSEEEECIVYSQYINEN